MGGYSYPGYTLSPEEQARMQAHLEGGGTLGSWQYGDRPPSAAQYESMSEEERRALGLTTPDAYSQAGNAWRSGFNDRQAAAAQMGSAPGFDWTFAPWVPEMGQFGTDVRGQNASAAQTMRGYDYGDPYSAFTLGALGGFGQ